MTKVGINLLWLVPGVVGGSETYTTRLLHGLVERSSDLDYTLFALPQFADAHSDLARSFKIAYAPLSGLWKSFRVAGENSWLAAQCRKRNIDLVHHAGGTVPPVRFGRAVLTVHDIQYLFYPEYFTRSKLTYLKKMVPRSAEAARLVLTPSEFTRRTVIERLRIEPATVIPVPHGISPRTQRNLKGAEVRDRYGISSDFFLYPAITYPHKNHLVLLEAFAHVLDSHPSCQLVLTGARGSMEVRLAKVTRDLGIEKSVRRLGYISADHLDALYTEAVAMTFPSRFEGFGAPVLEAMRRGCPVIAADATALPEVVGDSGYLVSPDNAEHWAGAMLALAGNPGRRAELRAAGLERAALFTWERSADLLEGAYSHALGTTL
jgi:glycosyltransferase involved in cell wall biosynthesis